MRLRGARVLLTGGGGGIGRAIAAELLARGAAVLLADRDERALAAAAALDTSLGTCAADLGSAADRARLCETAQHWRGGVNVLINNAGLNHFTMFAEQPPAQIDAALAVNVGAPLHLCRALLPHLLRQPEACILNIGSVFGGIGYPGYAVYSATKFATRGFTEALRRELGATGVQVLYLAPRATRTPINSPAVERLNAELGVRMDPPERVAREAARLIESARARRVIGWPEKLFVRVNALLPRVVDAALRRQLPIIRRHATGTTSAATPAPAAPASTDPDRSIS